MLMREEKNMDSAVTLGSAQLSSSRRMRGIKNGPSKRRTQTMRDKRKPEEYLQQKEICKEKPQVSRYITGSRIRHDSWKEKEKLFFVSFPAALYMLSSLSVNVPIRNKNAERREMCFRQHPRKPSSCAGGPCTRQ